MKNTPAKRIQRNCNIEDSVLKTLREAKAPMTVSQIFEKNQSIKKSAISSCISRMALYGDGVTRGTNEFGIYEYSLTGEYRSFHGVKHVGAVESTTAKKEKYVRVFVERKGEHYAMYMLDVEGNPVPEGAFTAFIPVSELGIDIRDGSF